MNLKELYQEIILDHGKNPRNLRKTENFNKDAKGHNPLCGDKVHIYLKLNENKKVEDISFEGSGCAISMASASIMTDLIRGRKENEVKDIVKDFLHMIKEKPELIQVLANPFSLTEGFTGPTQLDDSKKLKEERKHSEHLEEEFEQKMEKLISNILLI